MLLISILMTSSLNGADESSNNYNAGAPRQFRQICITNDKDGGIQRFYAAGKRSQQQLIDGASIISETRLDWASPGLAACDRLSFASDRSGMPMSPLKTGGVLCFAVPIILPEKVLSPGLNWEREFRLLDGDKLRAVKVKYFLDDNVSFNETGLARISFDWSGDGAGPVRSESGSAGSGAALFDLRAGRVIGEMWETNRQDEARMSSVSCAWMEENG